MINAGNECTGCRACEKRCPAKAIVMAREKDEFYYPIVENNKCINCGLCNQVCPNNNEKCFKMPIKVYAAQYLCDQNLLNSTSGAAFWGLSKGVIDIGGYAVGAAYGKSWDVHHIIIDSVSELYLLQGAKYAQSNVEDTYMQTKNLLETGNKVIYSGTPCEIAGLKAYLGEDYDDLYTVDIICHGVPSVGLFKKYIKWIEQRLHEDVISYNFRSKKKGWGTQYLYQIKTKTKTKTGNGNLDPFYHTFLKGNSLRESCYRCLYARKERISDITLGDCWGIEKILPNFKSKKGVSLILLNTNKGVSLWNNVSNSFRFETLSYDRVMKYNKNLLEPTIRSRERDYLKRDTRFNERPFKIGLQLKDRISALLPWGIKRMLKRML